MGGKVFGGNVKRSAIVLTIAAGACAVFGSGLAGAGDGSTASTKVSRAPVMLLQTSRMSSPIGNRFRSGSGIAARKVTNLGPLFKRYAKQPRLRSHRVSGGRYAAVKVPNALLAATPAPTITGSPSNPTYERSASFSFTDSLAGVSYQCRLDGGSWTGCTSPTTYSNLKLGSRTFRVAAISGGRTSTVRTFSWTVLAPPAPTITPADPNNPTSNRSASFSFADSLAGVTFNCRLDGASWAACTTPTSYAGPLSFGTHTFRVQAAYEGGTSSAASYAWSVVPPTPTITAGPTNPTTSTSASFSFTDSQARVSYVCSLDGATFGSCVSPKTYAGPLAIGAHAFQVRAVSGGVQSLSATYSWTVNSPLPPAPPVPTINSSPTNPSTSTSAQFGFVDTDPTATFLCSLDGATYSACTSPATYTLAAGQHTFGVKATNAGGTSSAATYAWTINPPAPPAPSIDSSPANPTSATGAQFAFSDTDPSATFLCSLDGAKYVACTSPATYSSLSVAQHSFAVEATNAGGTSTATTFTWTINPPPPPTPSIDSKPSDPSGSTSAQLAFSDTDQTATFLCSLDNATYSACTNPTSYSLLQPGQHTFAVEARNTGGTSAPTSYSWNINALSVKMRLLVISGNGAEQYDFAPNPNCSPTPCKGAIQTYLDQLGVPYDTLIASQVQDPNNDGAALAAQLGLSNNLGNYDGIILASGDLGYLNGSGAYVSGFDSAEWQTLWQYEAKFGVRQVTSDTSPYGAPLFDYGLTQNGATSTEVDVTLTPSGRQLFSYLNPNATIPLLNTYTYLATVSSSLQAGESVTPLATDAQGNVIAATTTFPDGRENLEMTTGNAPWDLHTKLFSYGLVNWLTHGVFVGSRHVTLDAQVDDLLIDGQLWDTNNHVESPETQSGCCYRMSAGDFQNLITWQNGLRNSSPLLQNLRLEFAFNGEGAFGDPPNYPATDGSNSIYSSPNPDPLTQEIVNDQSNFCYINHTYQHQNVDLTTYQSSTTEIQENQQAAAALGLGCYSNTEFVQPDISGLSNDAFQRAAYDSGVRYLITDTSQPGWNNPTPNAGFPLTNSAGTQLLAIPRHPNNLFWNLNTPAQWVDEYNCIYTFGYDSGTPNCDSSPWKFWQTPLDYQQILDVESNNLLSYLLSWDIDPWMFHQLNADSYDSQGDSLLGDLLNATFAKYRSYYNLPVVNLTQQGVGQMMTQRMAYNASGVDATVVPCQSMTISVTTAATIPVTGSNSGTPEIYGGQPIASLDVTPGNPVTIPITCSN